jgi:hypothetical protein
MRSSQFACPGSFSIVPPRHKRCRLQTPLSSTTTSTHPRKSTGLERSASSATTRTSPQSNNHSRGRINVGKRYPPWHDFSRSARDRGSSPRGSERPSERLQGPADVSASRKPGREDTCADGYKVPDWAAGMLSPHPSSGCIGNAPTLI